MPSFTTDSRLQGPLTIDEIQRSWCQQDQLAVYPISPMAWRVWDAPQTNLPGTSASDDLGLYGATWATNSPYLATYDIKTLTTTLRARTFLYLPPEYDPGETFTLRFYCGMKTTVAGTSCTIDAEMYEMDGSGGIGADIVSTVAQSMNSLTFANKDFTVTPTNLTRGDLLDLRVTISSVDAATGTAVIAAIGMAYMLIDIRG